MACRCIRKIASLRPVRSTSMVTRLMHGCFLVYVLYSGATQAVQAQDIERCDKNNTETCKPIHVDGLSEPSRIMMSTNGDLSIHQHALQPSHAVEDLRASSSRVLLEKLRKRFDIVEPLITGTCVENGVYPWTVALLIAGADPGTGFFCGGSILNKRWVVTANHCVEGKKEHDVTIYSGSVRLWNPAQKRGVVKIIRHKSYNSQTLDNDIALLKLDRDLDLTSDTPKSIRLLSTAEEKYYASPKTLATVLGWGATNKTDKDSISNQLQKVDEPIHTNQECRDAYGESVTDNMICAGYDKGGKGTCSLDSGGPLVVPTSRGWTDVRYGSAPLGWYVGDFNGDGKDDIFRYCPPDHPCGNIVSGAQVFLSTGSRFESAGIWTRKEYGSAKLGWYVGDFNGDGKDDIFRYCPPDHPCGNVVSGAQVYLSTGSRFEYAGSWTREEYGTAPLGWYVGDFNGDGKDDILRYCPSDQPCGNVVSGAQVFLSTGSRFEDAGSWTREEYGTAPLGWYVGDFNGDGKDDIFRYCPHDQPCGNIASGAQMFLSTGSRFENKGSWTSKGYGAAPLGWYVGDFNGDGKDDILRKVTGKTFYCDDEALQSEVLLSAGNKFDDPVVWGDGELGNAPNGWYVGNFDGDSNNKDDLLRYVPVRTGAEVFTSTGYRFLEPDMKFVLAGLVSKAAGCAEPNAYDVYTRVSRYEGWVKEHMQ